MLAGDAKFLELESASNKQLMEVTNFSFEFRRVGFNSFAYSIQKFRYSNFHCNRKTMQLRVFGWLIANASNTHLISNKIEKGMSLKQQKASFFHIIGNNTKQNTQNYNAMVVYHMKYQHFLPNLCPIKATR